MASALRLAHLEESPGQRLEGGSVLGACNSCFNREAVSCCRLSGEFLFASLAIPQPQSVTTAVQRTEGEELLAEIVIEVRAAMLD